VSTLRVSVDPELATLRRVARPVDTLDLRSGRERERARFAVYAALEGSDLPTARRWCATLRASLLGGEEDSARVAELRALGLAALDSVEQAIGEAT